MQRELATSAHTTARTLLLGSRHVGDIVEHSGAAAILAACDTILLLPQHVRDAWLVRTPPTAGPCVVTAAEWHRAAVPKDAGVGIFKPLATAGGVIHCPVGPEWLGHGEDP